MDNADLRKKWGGGILGIKSQHQKDLHQAAIEKEALKKANLWALNMIILLTPIACVIYLNFIDFVASNLFKYLAQHVKWKNSILNDHIALYWDLILNFGQYQ